MFGVGFTELLLIMVVALFAVGPKRLPGVAKALGRGYSEFKSALDDMKKTVVTDMADSLGGVKDLRNTVNDITRSVVTEATKPLEETRDAYKNIYLDNLLSEREKEAAQQAPGPPPDLDAEPAPVPQEEAGPPDTGPKTPKDRESQTS
jgi:Tat protein translocase TatB subunit